MKPTIASLQAEIAKLLEDNTTLRDEIATLRTPIAKRSGRKLSFMESLQDLSGYMPYCAGGDFLPWADLCDRMTTALDGKASMLKVFKPGMTKPRVKVDGAGVRDSVVLNADRETVALKIIRQRVNVLAIRATAKPELQALAMEAKEALAIVGDTVTQEAEIESLVF